MKSEATTAKTPRVSTALAIDVTTTIHPGSFALVSRKLLAESDVMPVLVASAKKSHKNRPMIRSSL